MIMLKMRIKWSVRYPCTVTKDVDMSQYEHFVYETFPCRAQVVCVHPNDEETAASMR